MRFGGSYRKTNHTAFREDSRRFRLYLARLVLTGNPQFSILLPMMPWVTQTLTAHSDHLLLVEAWSIAEPGNQISPAYNIVEMVWSTATWSGLHAFNFTKLRRPTAASICIVLFASSLMMIRPAEKRVTRVSCARAPTLRPIFILSGRR